jgi:hypothetical protein
MVIATLLSNGINNQKSNRTSLRNKGVLAIKYRQGDAKGSFAIKGRREPLYTF